jgi:DNA-binding beta-propeller fold protein YncE
MGKRKLSDAQIARTHFWNGEKMKHKSATLAAFLVLATLSAFGASSGYHLLKKVSIPGAGGWDYVTVDAAARRVYISHATQVEILDADTSEIVGKIPDTPGVHGVALAPESGRGFITAGKSDAVIIFDLKTLKPISQVKVGKKPDAIVYDPATKRVFAMNGDSDSTTAINSADGTVAGTVDLGGGPEFPVADGKGNLYVNLEEENLLVHVDTQSLKVKDRWPVAPCQAPSSMAFDAELRRLFLGCRSHVMAVVDADSGKVVATYPIGDHVDASFFDPATRLVLHSLGDGNVAVFHQDSADKYTFVENIATNKGSKTMGFDPKTHHLFVPANQEGVFTILVLGQ